MPTQPTQPPPAIEALFDQYFNQTLTPEGMAQLEAWLAEDPANAQVLARAGLAHGLTREVVKAQMQSNLRPRVLHFAAPALLAASVLLAVGVGVYWQSQQAQVEAVVAKSEAPAAEKLTPKEKATRVNQLLIVARALQRNGQTEQALDAAEQAWAAAPQNMAAEMLTEMLRNELHLKSSDELLKQKGNHSVAIGLENRKVESSSFASSLTPVQNTGSAKPGAAVASPAPAMPVSIGGDSGGITVVSGARNKHYAAAVRIEELGGKLNLNTASPEVLKAFGIIEPADPETTQLRTTVSIPDPAAWPRLFERRDSAVQPIPPSRDQYAHLYDNKFTSPLIQPLSTFSVDVDTAAYANMRRFVSEGSLPPPDAVRIEEMLNYFSYDYAPPAVLQPGEKIGDAAPFAAHTEVCACPWNPAHKLVRIGLKGAEVDMSKRPQAHLTFLLDVSGSMDEADKLPLAKQALIRLLAQLRPDDHVSLVVYAGNSGCVLENAPCSEKAQILGAIDRLSAGGSTAGAQGINQAYELAQKHFVKGGVNRVILCTDGDFNVGTSDTGSLIRLAKEKANPKDGNGVFLSTCGFGRGNLNDRMMEQVADAGNGNYAYIDSLAEAEKVFVKQAGGTLVAIAKDVKLQLEFNPAKVGKYRLIGYENRVLKAEDFNDDTVDAGDIGAGHTVTALYEIEPVGTNPYASVDEEIKDLERQVKEIEDFAARARLTEQAAAAQKQALDALAARIAQLKTPAADRSVDPLTYQNARKISEKAQESGELLTLKLRYKSPEAKAEQGTSKLLKFTLKDADTAFDKASADTRFAASVAAYGMILRGSEHKGTATLGWVAEVAGGTCSTVSVGVNPPSVQERINQREEFVNLIRKAQVLKKD